jgi:hypothetical protein
VVTADALQRVPTAGVADAADSHPGVPASAGGMPASPAASCQERLIRLKPGLLSGDIWIKNVNVPTLGGHGGRAAARPYRWCGGRSRQPSGSPGFSRWDACRERLIRLKPGLLSGDIRIKNVNVPTLGGHGGRAAARPYRWCGGRGRQPSGSPGFSRWNACLASGILPGMPDPAEAGTPERRYPD